MNLTLQNAAKLLALTEERRLLAIRETETLFKMQTAVVAEMLKASCPGDMPEGVLKFNIRLLAETFSQSRNLRDGWSLGRVVSVLAYIGVHKRAAFMSLGADRFDPDFAAACKELAKSLEPALAACKEEVSISLAAGDADTPARPKPSV